MCQLYVNHGNNDLIYTLQPTFFSYTISRASMSHFATLFLEESNCGEGRCAIFELFLSSAIVGVFEIDN